jgi:NosR/NirI family nitrous oxide reductase transcriptional regulator
MLKRYMHWLHGQWPSGQVEKMPLVNGDGTTNLTGVYVVGDLTGVPLLKFAADSGAKAIRHLIESDNFSSRKQAEDIVDVVIIGAGVSGYSAVLEAQQKGLKALLIESTRAFSTIENFPAGKPIYTYPANMEHAGKISLDEDVSNKESLLASLKKDIAQHDIETLTAKASHIERKNNLLHVITEEKEVIRAHRVVVAIGRSGNFRQLEAKGQQAEKVVNRLHDPKAYAQQDVLVVGGGDSALESAIAIAIAEQGGKVSLSYRKASFSRPKADNLTRLTQLQDDGKITLYMQSKVDSISPDEVDLTLADGQAKTIKNNTVLSMIGREAPLDFFRRSKMDIAGESTLSGWAALAAFMVFAIALYDWKNFGFFNSIWGSVDFPNNMPSVISGFGQWWQSQVEDRSTLIGTIAVSMKSRSFYYTILYTSCIGFFGWQRVQRRKTPYVKVQTLSLFFIQFIPLFILPEVILPWAGYLGAFDAGNMKTIADSLFPSYISAEALANQEWPEWGHPRAYWHAYGFILAWPLNVYNVFTPTPMVGWLIISFVQTFIIIPALIYRFGKGAYCGWICSCGALAETLGDTQRHKMPHGPFWNKLNMIGQVILFAAIALLAIRILGWVFPESWMNLSFDLLLKGENAEHQLVNPISWKWFVDVLLGGVLGVGLYFKYSGRIWCRFACPLAALMHIYGRFSRFRILSNKSKCISCNACTSVCHQGIDVMSFANKGLPMEDPECVRCSACVSTCPTGTLEFGQVDKNNNIIATDRLAASPVKIVEARNV